MHTSNTQAPEA
jgi:hypothetical protein